MLDFPVDQHSLRALNKCTRVDKVHPARHAAGLLVGETLAGYDPHS